MTTSGTAIYQMSGDQLITAALRKLAVLAEGQTPTSKNLSDGREALNAAIASLRSIGMPVWTRVEYTYTPTTGSATIGVGKTLNTPFPVKLLQAYRTETNTKIDLEIKARHDFNTLPVGSSGSPIIVSYESFINYGVVSLWPAPPTTNTSTITLVYQRPFEYIISGSNTFDFPEEWYNALIYRLAGLLAPEWSIPLPDRQALKAEAKEYLDEALSVGQDTGSFFIQPARST